MAKWLVENFKKWPNDCFNLDADPSEIGCEFQVLEPHTLPVLRCCAGSGYVDSLTWWYAKRSKGKQ